MLALSSAQTVFDAVVRLADRVPDDEDVTAGWTALLLFVLLIGAVVLLGFSLVKQLRKAQAAQDAGVYGDDADPGSDGGSDGGSTSSDAPDHHSAS